MDEKSKKPVSVWAVVFLKGTERGSCYGNKTCDTGLECRSNVCVK